jgi:hypothetical protein
MNKYYSKKYLWSNKNFIGIECFLHRNFIYLFIYIYGIQCNISNGNISNGIINNKNEIKINLKIFINSYVARNKY